MPCLRRVMYMGESDSTVSQPPKPVCDWILGCAESDVKEKTSDLWITLNALINRVLLPRPAIGPQWKNCEERAQSGQPFQSNSAKDLGLLREPTSLLRPQPQHRHSLGFPANNSELPQQNSRPAKGDSH